MIIYIYIYVAINDYISKLAGAPLLLRVDDAGFLPRGSDRVAFTCLKLLV